MPDDPRRNAAHAQGAQSARRHAAERAAAVAAAIRAECDVIDDVTTDPAVRAAATRIRTILTDGPPTVPCTATEPHGDGGLYTCNVIDHGGHTMHYDEHRQRHWTSDPQHTA